jgi:hypothetical protein
MTALTTKFKYERQKLTDPSVVAFRKKFASKRPMAPISAEENITEAKRKTRVEVKQIELK